MQRQKRIVLRIGAAFLALFLVSCGKKGQTVNGITIDKSVPSDQADLLAGDIRYLNALNLQPYTTNDIYVMGVSDLSGASIGNWYQTYTKVIVGENFDYKGKSSSTPSGPYAPQVAAASNIVTVMFNLGSYLYLSGKSSNSIYSIMLDGGQQQVRSVAIGIVQIGEGLFNNSRLSFSALTSEASRIARGGTQLHECGHSRGNGANAGFPHAYCSTGDYAGRNSCENNLNGPYGIQAMFVTNAYVACRTCTTQELDALAGLIVDYRGRMQPGAQFRDARPETI